MPSPSVLIVGAGPSGLILAIVLLKNGIPVRIIDKEPKHRIGSRGTGIQPRTLELYDILGVLPDILNAGGFVTHIARYNPGEREPVSKFPLSEWVEPTPDVPHPNALTLGQEEHEAILRKHLADLSCSVELASELLDLEQFPDHVVAHIVKTDADGTKREEHTSFEWLIGTDGAHSLVRHRLELSFLGETRTEQPVALGDILVEEGVDPKTWHMWSVSPKLFRAILRASGTDSKVFMFLLSGRLEDAAGKTITREEFIEEFYELTQRRDIKFGKATWLTNYRANIRMVEKFRVRRVFIAGDAAHCHSPTGAQGLNSSVQDAANLGWKLALAHKRLARDPDALLDTYGEERLRVIAQMLQLTTVLYEKNLGSQRGLDAQEEERAWNRGTDMRMLGVNYCGSSIIRERAEDELAAAGGSEIKSADAYGLGGGRLLRVRPAYRAPDAPGLIRKGANTSGEPTRLFDAFRISAHTVLLFGANTPAAYADVATVLRGLPAGTIRVLRIHARNWHESSNREAISDASSFHKELELDMEDLEDAEGHAYTGYGLPHDELRVVVVRPDGVVGAVESSAAGVALYFHKILQ